MTCDSVLANNCNLSRVSNYPITGSVAAAKEADCTAQTYSTVAEPHLK